MTSSSNSSKAENGGQSATSGVSMQYSQLHGALAVVDVEIRARRWWQQWPRPLLPPATTHDQQHQRRWGFGLEPTSCPTMGHAVEVAWSRAPGVRPGDVLLAVNGQVVAGWPPAQVAKLLEATAATEDASAALRLTLDTSKGWGASSGARRRKAAWGWARWLYHTVLDGFERLLDARACASRKLGLHALALVLLFPIVESTFQSLNTLSLRHAPLALADHATVLRFELLWSAAYFLCSTLVGLGYAFSSRRPALTCVATGVAATLLHALLLTLLLPAAAALATLATSGFLLPTDPEALDPAALQDELGALLTHVLCVLVLPPLLAWYLRRFATFCAGYAHVGRGKNPKLLGLAMPLSAHFAGPDEGERARFLALRACGY